MFNRLKVLTNRAHCGHQYELWKLPIEVYIVSGIGDRSEKWSYDMRPFPENARYIKADEINVGDYDLAIAHFDENALYPRHPVLDDTWGSSFQWIINNLSKELPTIAVCHGAPQFEEQGRIEIATENVTIYEDRRERLVNFLKDVPVVCNSYDAEKTWGFKKSCTIWHGFDPEEFIRGKRKRGVLAIRKDALKGRPHCRGYYTHNKIMAYLPEEYHPEWTTVEKPYQFGFNTQEYAIEKFKRYVDSIGNYKVFLNTTVHSPMPRSRGEAMMCGLVSVNYDSHDINRIVENGVDGFYSKDPKELADILSFLMENPVKTLKMGNRSREKAKKLLNIDRYLSDWMQQIKGVI